MPSGVGGGNEKQDEDKNNRYSNNLNEWIWGKKIIRQRPLDQGLRFYQHSKIKWVDTGQLAAKETDENHTPAPWLYVRADLLTWGLVMPSVLHPPEAFVWLWRPRPREETLSLFLWASLAVCANWEPFPMVSRCSQRKEACHGPKSIPRNDFPSCWMYDIPLSKALPFAVSAPDIFLRAYVRMWSVLSILFSFCNNMGWGVNYDLHWEHPWVSSSWIGLLYQCWKTFKIRSQTSLAPFLSRPGRWACFGFQKPPESFYRVLFHEVCTINFWGLHH